MAKITQIAGRNALGTFAPDFAHFNDDVLFGENWNNEDIDLKTRSIITVVALMAQGITDSSFSMRRTDTSPRSRPWSLSPTETIPTGRKRMKWSGKRTRCRPRISRSSHWRTGPPTPEK